MKNQEKYSVRWSLWRQVCLFLLLTTPITTQAVAIYEFTSAPFAVTLDNSFGLVVADDPGFFSSPFGTTPVTATLEFDSPLAPNTTTTIQTETGNLGIVFPSPSGNVVAYETGLLSSLPITSDIMEYSTGSAVDGVLNILALSSLQGSVTTDTLGNISAWDLAFRLTTDVGDGFVWVGPGSKPPGFPDASFGLLDQQILISSDSPFSTTLMPDILNGAPTSDPFTFDSADTAFFDPGPSQINLHTSQPGSFAETVIPVPAALPLFGFSLAGLGFFNRKRKTG